MIDIHCHILPGVDDGAPTMQEALMMAALAADDGVDSIVATPHVTWDGRPLDESLERISKAYIAFSRALREAHIPIRILRGAEVLCLDTTAFPPAVGRFPCIGNSRYALVEFNFEAQASEIEAHINALRNGGIIPIVAHPERYTASQRDKTLCTRLIRSGCLLQLNKGSALGQFGFRVRRTAQRLLQEQAISFLATDAHGSGVRSPRMRHVYDTLSEKYGVEYINRITTGNPTALLRDITQMAKAKSE